MLGEKNQFRICVVTSRLTLGVNLVCSACCGIRVSSVFLLSFLGPLDSSVRFARSWWGANSAGNELQASSDSHRLHGQPQWSSK